ncbi:uncharacterized protein DNG_02253 [Cephalotrichum gorgonifer]|uniref:Uncharacterized protein n=1 Tax=Cephalotrichum gorgonifer TaxID=2041049 RepID=A0AAE8MT92_9PEZI|nr:uncharacterized protein DNG_02253 [Cephalotrichum gorgonifer]
MDLTTSTHRAAKTLAQKAKATIAALSTTFTTDHHHASISPNLTLWSAIQTAYKTTQSTFSLPQDSSLPLSSPSSPALVIDAIFDTDAKLFFDSHSQLVSSLPPTSKAALLAQAIAGLVLFFERLGSELEGEEVVTDVLFARELEAFRASEERRAALGAVEASDVWGSCCGGAEEIAGVVMGVVERAGDEFELAGMLEEGGAAAGGWEDGAMPGFEVGRPRNMGLPWGFSILPVN